MKLSEGAQAAIDRAEDSANAARGLSVALQMLIMGRSDLITSSPENMAVLSLVSALCEAAQRTCDSIDVFSKAAAE